MDDDTRRQALEERYKDRLPPSEEECFAYLYQSQWLDYGSAEMQAVADELRSGNPLSEQARDFLIFLLHPFFLEKMKQLTAEHSLELVLVKK